MQRLYRFFALLAFSIVIAHVTGCGGGEEPPVSEIGQNFVDIVTSGESDIFRIASDRYGSDIKDLPIGVFDSGIGGLTVLAEILDIDAFDNDTHERGPDGRPDFENERFIYHGDQANMPYGNYPSEDKVDFLRELIVKDAAFLLGTRYWLSGDADAPRYDKPPVKAIVIACNTATAYGLEDVRAALETWGLPVYLVGVVEAGAQGAIEVLAGKESDGGGAVAVMATVGTCRSGGYPRAIEKLAREAGMPVPDVTQQGSLGLAGAIEGDKSFIACDKDADAAGYRGPAVDNEDAPIDPALARQYAFESEGLLGDPADPGTWRLNSVENYIRYDAATLVANHGGGQGAKPIAAVILGCTHFPFHMDQIAAAFDRIRSYRAADGTMPYSGLIAENVAFIDPSEITAEQLYEALAGRKLLLGDDESAVIPVDEFYISVPNESLAGVKTADSGGFTYEYKYGRSPGDFTVEYVKRVPMSGANLSKGVRESIGKTMPGVWKRLVRFNSESPRTKDLPDEQKLR